MYSYHLTTEGVIEERVRSQTEGFITLVHLNVV